jgi:hypothetical protein
MADDQPTGPEPAPPGRPAGRRWQLAVEVASLIAAVIAVIAYVFPRATGGDGGPGRTDSPGAAASTGAAASAGDPTGSQPAGSQPSVSGPTAPAAPAGPSRFLSELTPSAGGFYLTRNAANDQRHALVMPCPPGTANSQSREVVYDLRGQYGRLIAGVQVSGSPDPPARTTVVVFADKQRARVVNLTGNAIRAESITLGSPQQLTLQISCGSPRTTVTFLVPQLFS